MPGNSNYPTDLLSTTWEIFMRKMPSDAIFGDLVLWDVLSKKAHTTKKGGIKILEPLMYAKSTAVGSYSGWDTFDISPQEGLTHAEFDWKFYYLTVAISQEEEDRNSGEAAVIDLLEAKIKQAKMSLADKVNTDLFLDGTGNSSKEITGLALAVDSAGTYGNIARASNTWWGANETNVGGALAVAGASGLRRMYNDCSLGRGRRTPDFGVTTQIVYEAYEALMDSNMRYSTGGEQNVGFKNQNLRFRDMSLFYDDLCQSGVLYMLNAEFMKLVTFNEKSGGVSKGERNDSGDFRLEPFMKPINQAGRVAKAFWAGQLTMSNCRHQGKLTGLTNT